MSQNYGLGRGLSSLIPPKNKKIKEPGKDFNYFGSSSSQSGEKNNTTSQNQEGQIFDVEIDRIVPNPFQPRLNFNREKLEELANSIKKHGIIQPLIVSKNEKGYELVAGERRLEASKLAGFSKVPVIVQEVDDEGKLNLAVVENIQRHNLNPIEEARAYDRLSREFGFSQEEIAQKLGKSRSSVANKMRLLELPVEVQRAISEEKITEGHAKAVLAVKGKEKQLAFFEMILKDSLTVRQAESKSQEVSIKAHKRKKNRDPKIEALENQLTGALGTKVKITSSKKGGRIFIEYYSDEELENILSKIG